ncbi:MAG: hypothetical protein M0Q44_10045 [Methylobacter sp.]|jgi:hypothetical protein|nr:hypothetical protein [Methylobacter sp.]
MRPIPNLLNEMISVGFHFSRVEKNILRLVEEKENLSVEFKIKDSESIACFSFDKDKQSGSDTVFPFFNSAVKGLCTKNDYILVHQKGSQVYVFLIELKSKNNGEYLKQLRAGKLFFQFVIDRIRLCNSDFEGLDKDDFHYKGILFKIDRGIPEKGISRHKKLEFNKTQDLDVSIQNYHNVYYLSQFI